MLENHSHRCRCVAYIHSWRCLPLICPISVVNFLNFHVRCPFLRRLDFSNPLPTQGGAFGLEEAAGVFGALVDSLCPLEELDMRGHW